MKEKTFKELVDHYQLNELEMRELYMAIGQLEVYLTFSLEQVELDLTDYRPKIQELISAYIDKRVDLI